MGTRAQTLADEYERANRDLIETAQACSDAEWRAICTAESWSVGVTAHHVAAMAGLAAELLREACRGRPWPPITWPTVHEGNGRHAEQHRACTIPETAALLARNGTAVADILRALGDEELDRAFPAAWRKNAPLSLEQLVRDHLIGHIGSHLSSIRAAIGVRAGQARSASL
jgi:hypothetical protein